MDHIFKLFIVLYRSPFDLGNFYAPETGRILGGVKVDL